VPALAVVGGSPITVADLDEQARAAAANRDAALARLWRESVEETVRDRLLEREAAARHATPEALYFEDAVRPLKRPSDAEVRKEYAAAKKRGERRKYEKVRDFYAGTILDRGESSRYRAWCERMEKRVSVRYEAAADGASAPPDAAVASVAGESVHAADVLPRYGPLRAALLRDVFDRQHLALDAAVHKRLLDTEAARRGVSPEELARAEVQEKVVPVSDSDVAAEFEKYRDMFDGGLAENAAEIREYLEERRRTEAVKRFDASVAEAPGVRATLAEPPRFVASVADDRSPSRGPADARVTLVEFGDFECPACGMMHRVVEKLLRTRGDRVRFEFRQFPLSMHPRARRAAEAAMAAAAQGKFWEYYELLFTHQKALDDASLRRYAAQCGLDARRFARDLESRAYGSRVVRDQRDGRRANVRWTPFYFVNGVEFSSEEPDGLEKAVDAALDAAPAAAAAH
jgi:protein-disulfide isomerase